MRGPLASLESASPQLDTPSPHPLLAKRHTVGFLQPRNSTTWRNCISRPSISCTEAAFVPRLFTREVPCLGRGPVLQPRATRAPTVTREQRSSSCRQRN